MHPAKDYCQINPCLPSICVGAVVVRFAAGQNLCTTATLLKYDWRLKPDIYKKISEIL